MPDRRFYNEARRQEFLYGFGFRRRFDDDKWFLSHADPRTVNAFSIDGLVKPRPKTGPGERAFQPLGRSAELRKMRIPCRMHVTMRRLRATHINPQRSSARTRRLNGPGNAY